PASLSPPGNGSPHATQLPHPNHAPPQSRSACPKLGSPPAHPLSGMASHTVHEHLVYRSDYTHAGPTLPPGSAEPARSSDNATSTRNRESRGSSPPEGRSPDWHSGCSLRHSRHTHAAHAVQDSRRSLVSLMV